MDFRLRSGRVAAATLFVLGIAAVAAQHAETTLPQAYQLQFENEWVKVVRVHYAPYVKLPSHAHTAWAAAYVYLSDAGPVVFRHVGAEYGSATRPAVKAGTFRLFRAVGEMHEVENTSPLASDFLRVEFKTEPKDEKMLRGRFHRVAVPAGENLEKVEFEHAQIRVTRLVIAPGKTLELVTGATEPSLLVSLSATPAHTSGDTRWLPVSRTERLENHSSEPLEYLRFAFVSQPIRSEAR
jgi:hypothetical protein